MSDALPKHAFRDVERADRIVSRLQHISSAASRVMEMVVESPDPDSSLSNLDRWLGSKGDIGATLEMLLEHPALCSRLTYVLGASNALADVLAQNPELAMLLGDSATLETNLSSAEIKSEGQRLLAASTSFHHSLDRIRFLKQQQMVRIVWQDISGWLQPEDCWLALSELADAVLQLVTGVVAQEIHFNESDIAVIALGKHGSQELNYSSDVDLIFVADEECDIELATRFCEKFVRAVEGKMGRGFLYRVDLRLRPLGSAGPIVQKLQPSINYYMSYCEPWEILALVRARACAGDPGLGTQFIESVKPCVYKENRTDVFLGEIVSAKRRYEHVTSEKGESETNIKLGTGGIRDIEFYTQMHQLLLGHANPSLIGKNTTSALRELVLLGELSLRICDELTSTYTLLRQLEHRIQLRGDLQSHTLPASGHERAVVAQLTGYLDWTSLEARVRRQRAIVRAHLESRIPSLASVSDVMDTSGILDGIHAEDATSIEAIRKLILHSLDSSAFTRQIREDAATKSRVELIVRHAPRVVPQICYHPDLWDVAFSEEVELLPQDDPVSINRSAFSVPGKHPMTSLANYLRREQLLACLKHAYHRDVFRTSKQLVQTAEAAILEVLEYVGGSFVDVVAMGRLGSKELLLSSDWDVVLLVEDEKDQARGERVGEEWLKHCRKVAMASEAMPVDVRLRPEGNAGLVVRSVSGLKKYAETARETWERIAFSRARSLRNWRSSEEAIRHFVEAGGWSRENEREVLAMRDRVQRERLRSWERSRDIKLGEGFQLDLEWLCSILRIRHKELRIDSLDVPGTLHRLAEERVINAIDAVELADAAVWYAKVRNVLFLLDMDTDTVLPENPDKLDRVAASLGASGSNDVLQITENHRSRVSAWFTEVMSKIR